MSRARWSLVALGAATGGVVVLVWLWAARPSEEKSPAERGPGVALTVEVPPAPVIADWPFQLRTSWSTDLPRRLLVGLTQEPTCEGSIAAALGSSAPGPIVVDQVAAASGSRVDEVTIPTVGSYIACGYLQANPDSARPAEVVSQSPRRVRITTTRTP